MDRGELREIDDNTFAWLAPGPLSNATVFAAEEAIVCVDALPSPGGAVALSEETRRRFGRDIDLLIYSHYHTDHIAGAAGISTPSHVVAHTNTREVLASRGPADLRTFMEARFPDEAGSAEVIPPSLCFTDRMSLHLDGLELELTSVGHAHTDSDIVVYAPSTKVLVAGDVVFNGFFPVFRDADSGGWVQALDAVAAMDVETVVPGHGEPSSLEIVETLRAAITSLRAQVADAWSGGADPDEVRKHVHVAELAGWGVPERLDGAVGRIVAELEAGTAAAV